MPESKRILLIDIQSSRLNTCQQILTGKGYSVRTLSDPKSITAAVAGFRPDLIFIDDDIPGISAILALRLLKGHAILRNIPVIYFTRPDNIFSLSARTGADDYLVKPFDAGQLLAITAKFLDRGIA